MSIDVVLIKYMLIIDANVKKVQHGLEELVDNALQMHILITIKMHASAQVLSRYSILLVFYAKIVLKIKFQTTPEPNVSVDQDTYETHRLVSVKL